ncbi:MAG: hypothetical protein ACO1NO_03705 [Burkholderiaceae bacterium]
MLEQQKPTKEELQWMRSGPQPDGRVDEDLVESTIAKELVVRNPDGSLKLTDTGFKYMIGGC